MGPSTPEYLIHMANDLQMFDLIQLPQLLLVVVPVHGFFSLQDDVYELLYLELLQPISRL